MLLSEPRVHAENFGHKQRSFVAPGAGPDFQDNVLGLVGILGQEHHPDLFFEGSGRAFKAREFFLRHRGQLRVAFVQHALSVSNAMQRLFELTILSHYRFQVAVGLAVL